jgi:hypothetical protein
MSRARKIIVVLLILLAGVLAGVTLLALYRMPWLQVVATLSAFLVLVEALNKLERADPFNGAKGLMPRLRGLGWLFMPWAWRRERVVIVLKIFGWGLLALGAAGYVARIYIATPTFPPDVAVIAGFAVLIVRSRLKEG